MAEKIARESGGTSRRAGIWLAAALTLLALRGTLEAEPRIEVGEPVAVSGERPEIPQVEPSLTAHPEKPGLPLAILSVLAVIPVLRADCGCPEPAQSKTLLITTAPGHPGKGLVVCGHKEESHGGVVRGSEFEVFRCGDSRRLLAVGALETVDLKPAGVDLHMTRVSNWPFGAGWSWDYVPVAEAILAESGEAPRWKASLPKPRVRTEEIEAFLRAYRVDVQRAGRKYSPDEKVVGKLFVAMVAGNAEAKRLFWQMPKDVSLDGVVAEDYNTAVEDYRLGGQRPSE